MKARNTYTNIKYVVGIDEAGRGPLAGPVAVGAFCVKINDKKKLRRMFIGARDSKKMSVKKREEIFEKIKKTERIRFVVMMESAKTIDQKGISWAIQNCIRKCLAKFEFNPKQTFVLLDGGIKAPPEFIFQETIIKGDDKEMLISLASICAKVTRDTYMRKMAKRYPQYNLEIHKGYGTLTHRKKIKKYGASTIHRKTFLKNI